MKNNAELTHYVIREGLISEDGMGGFEHRFIQSMVLLEPGPRGLQEMEWKGILPKSKG